MQQFVTAPYLSYCHLVMNLNQCDNLPSKHVILERDIKIQNDLFFTGAIFVSIAILCQQTGSGTEDLPEETLHDLQSESFQVGRKEMGPEKLRFQQMVASLDDG